MTFQLKAQYRIVYQCTPTKRENSLISTTIILMILIVEELIEMCIYCQGSLYQRFVCSGLHALGQHHATHY
jgi:hypothetical protein